MNYLQLLYSSKVQCGVNEMISNTIEILYDCVLVKCIAKCAEDDNTIVCECNQSA